MTTRPAKKRRTGTDGTSTAKKGSITLKSNVNKTSSKATKENAKKAATHDNNGSDEGMHGSNSDDDDDDDEDAIPISLEEAEEKDEFSSDAYDEVSSSEGSEAEGEGDESDDSLDSVLASQHPPTTSKKRKRNDPTIFSTSLSKILSSHLTTTHRKDPVLVRSKKTTHHIDDSKLESKAKRILLAQRKAELEKGRVRDVVPQISGGADGEEVRRVLERERALRKVAQRGAVKLFNAVRAAQIKAEEAGREVNASGVVGKNKIERKGMLDGSF